MRQVRFAEGWLAAGAGAAVLLGSAPALAQGTEDLLRRIDALQRRVEELEAAQRTVQRPPPAAARAPATAPRTAAAPSPR
ncbi:hypothetical protein, partial [Neoroseomonas oryzicola]